MNTSSENKENMVIDIEYSDVLGTKCNYSTTEVAKMLGRRPSCIRFWCDEFEKCKDEKGENLFGFVVKRDPSNNNRLLDAENIAFLRQVAEITKNDSKMTIKKIKEHLSAEKNQEIQQMVQQQNIEQLTNAIKESLLQDIAILIKDNQVQMENNITEKMSKQLETKKEEIIKELSISMSENKDSIENTIQDTVKTSSDDIRATLSDSTSKLSTTLNNGLEDGLKRFKSYGDELEQKFSNRDEKNMANLRESMEKQLEKNRLEEIQKKEEKKKGILDKISGIFGK